MHPVLTSRPVRRIVALRANGLGDLFFATPALRALAKHFPSADVTYLCSPWLRGFIAGRYPYLRHVHAIPPYPGIRDSSVDPSIAERQRQRFFACYRRADFDLAIQMHGGGIQSNPFLRLIDARLSVGLLGSGATPLDVNVPYVFYQHEVLRYLELVASIGVADDGLCMDVPEIVTDQIELGQAWPEYQRSPFAVVHVGASDPRRRWPIDRFAAVADRLHREHGLTVVATGGASDRDLVRQLVAGLDEPAVDLSGRTSLGALAALIRRARLVVSNDTGVSNLAIAVNTPAVIVYWCGNVITAGPFTRTRHRPVLSWTVDCPECGRRQCSCRVSFVAAAPLDEVMHHVGDLLRQ